MRAREFVVERKGQISQRQQFGTVGLHLFGDGERMSSNYTLNRLMMAVAMTDGVTEPDMDETSWIGKSKSAHPYTKQEADMLKMAYKTVGATYKDVNRGDLKSEEPAGGNTASPVVAFRGYPR